MKFSIHIVFTVLMLICRVSYSQTDSMYTEDESTQGEVDSPASSGKAVHIYIYPTEDKTETKPILTSSDWKKTTDELKYPDGTLLTPQYRRQINLSWLKYIIYGFTILILIFIVYNIVRLMLKPSDRKVSKALTENEIDPEVLPVENLELLLKEAVSNNDFRSAVRYSYLITLRNLSDKKLIQRAKDKTNFDYINELSKYQFLNIFREITRAFEMTWYGEITPGEDAYRNFENKFIILNSSLKNSNN
jgi:hypothetical protein